MTTRELSPRSIPLAQRIEILEDPCYYCDSIRATVVDHVDPVAQGGGRETGNLVAACDRCNSEKGNKTPTQWRAWRIRRGYPWPPPDTDLFVYDAILAVGHEWVRRVQLALKANDARFFEALDRIRDRAWVGNDVSAEDDAEDIRAALEGVEHRVSGSRRRLIRKIGQKHVAAMQRYRDHIRRCCEGEIEYTSPVAIANKQAVLHEVAEDIAEFADRFLDSTEIAALRTMLVEANSWQVWRRRIIESGERIAELAAESEPYVGQAIATGLAMRVASFSELCTDEQNDKLRTILGAL